MCLLFENFLDIKQTKIKPEDKIIQKNLENVKYRYKFSLNLYISL